MYIFHIIYCIYLLLADADGVAVGLGPGEEVDGLGDVVDVLVLAGQVVAGRPGEGVM